MKWLRLTDTKLVSSPPIQNLPRTQESRAVHRQLRERLEKGSGQRAMRNTRLQRPSDHLQTGARRATHTPSRVTVKNSSRDLRSVGKTADGFLGRSKLPALHGRVRTSTRLQRTRSNTLQSLDRKISELPLVIQFGDHQRTNRIRGMGSLSEYDSTHGHICTTVIASDSFQSTYLFTCFLFSRSARER